MMPLPMRSIFLLAIAIVLTGCTPERPAVPEQPKVPAPEAVEMPADAAGVWQVNDENGEPFDLVLFPGGQVVSNWTKGSGKARGERGFWRMLGGRILVLFDDGWTDVLSAGEQGFVHAGFAPAVSPDSEKPTNTSHAIRFEKPEAAFVGVWRLNREPDGNYQYLNLKSTGTAMSTVGGGTEGRWELVGDAARCTWPDGWVDQIARVDGAWQKTSWVGAESGTHADLSPASRVGETRFSVDP